MAGDGSFANRTLFRTPIERVDLLCRTRQDAVLCWPAPASSRRRSGTETFTPEQVRRDDGRAWATTKLGHGGQRRKLRDKEVGGVLWRTGAQQRRLRLLVVAPTPYRRTRTGQLCYRKPADLLITDLKTPAAQLLQVDLDRWEIEVNCRDEKTTLGVGEAQLWSEKSVGRQPALVVAAYSALLLASLETEGATRTEAYRTLPQWRNKKSTRPSCLDLITLLRQQWHERPATAQTHGARGSYEQMVLSPAA